MGKAQLRLDMLLQVLKSCEDKLAEDPGDTQLMLFRGILNNMAQRYDEALKDFDVLSKAFPEESSLYFLKSDCYLNKKQYNRSKRDFMRGMGIQNNHILPEYVIEASILINDSELDDIRRIVEHEREKAIIKAFTDHEHHLPEA